MPAILVYLWKLSISIAFVWLFYKTVLSRLTFYQWNRWYLLGYALVCYFLPLMNIYSWMDDNAGGKLYRLVPAMHSWVNVQSTTVEAPLTAYDLLVFFLVFGTVCMLVRLLIQFISLRRMHKRARLLADDGVKLYAVAEPIIPFSFGTSVFIHPAQHDDAELKEIIRHEMVHVRERHSVDIVFSEILLAFNWFNPFAWLLRQSIRQNLEYIADQKVLANGLDRKQYQYLLLKVIGQQHFSIASHLNFSALKTRITMMNKIKSARIHLIRFLFALPILAILLLAFRQDRQTKKFEAVPDSHSSAVTKFIAVTDTTPINNKGYIVTIADNQGECIVIVKDGSKNLVKAVLLTDWNKAQDKYEGQYGKIPPPPPAPEAPGALAPLPPLPPGAPSPVVTVDAVPYNETLEPLEMEVPAAPAIAPLPPLPPRLPANIRSISIKQKKASVLLKNGKTEQYDLSIPKEKAAFEKKYGSPLPGEPVKIEEIKVDITPVSNVNVSTSVNVDTKEVLDVEVSETALILANGTEISYQQFKAIPPEDITELRVLTEKEAAGTYGKRGKNGVISITVKQVNRIKLFNPFKLPSSEKDKC